MIHRLGFVGGQLVLLFYSLIPPFQGNLLFTRPFITLFPYSPTFKGSHY
jgi:hypothetical protein